MGDFDKGFWEQHWRDVAQRGGRTLPPHPALVETASELAPGRALDAGSGEGVESIWLAEHGWQVTAVDISAEVLARATERASAADVAASVTWVEADLSVWEPVDTFDLVTTHYAHSRLAQLDFYERISHWVAPGGTLLIVGHLHTGHAGHEHPPEATADAAGITARLRPEAWDVLSVEESPRSATAPNGRVVELHDVVVRARRTR